MSITEDEIDNYVYTLTNTITSSIAEKVPTKTIKWNSIGLPIEIRELICQKRHQRRLWQRTRIPQYKTNANRLQKRISKDITEWSTVLEFLEFLELFWNFFGTGNVLEKSHFFRLVLELFLNSEFLTSDFLSYNISGCPLFGSPICEKIIFQFCPIFVMNIFLTRVMQ